MLDVEDGMGRRWSASGATGLNKKVATRQIERQPLVFKSLVRAALGFT